MSAALITEAELAVDVLRLNSESEAAELRRKHKWPHVRLGRFKVRYTEDQVAAIVAMQTTKPNKPQATPAISGQTTASRKRSA